MMMRWYDQQCEGLRTRHGADAVIPAAPLLVGVDHFGGVKYRKLLTPRKDWDLGIYKYDPYHWMGNVATAANAKRTSALAKRFMRDLSLGLFRRVKGEYARIMAHVSARGMALKGLSASHLRRRARYTIP
jgi:hypothetical protein